MADCSVLIPGRPNRALLASLARGPVRPAQVLAQAPRNGSTRAVALAEGLRSCAHDRVLVVEPDARPLPGMLEAYLRALSRPGAALVYGDYFRGRGPARERRWTWATESDLSEECDLGRIRAYRRSSIERAGGLDASLRWAAEYDLRLRLGERGRFVRVPEPLHATLSEEPPGLLERSSYLFYPPPLRAEVERVFVAALLRRGLRLAAPPRPLRCPHRRSAGPAVTVILRAHNREELVGRAIDSVLEGEFRDLELLAVDNASTDGTVREILRRAKDGRLRLIRSPRNRLAGAFNLALRQARGRYVAELDSDDEYLPRTLSAMTARLDSRPGSALAISYYERIDASGLPLGPGPVRHLEFDRDAILRTSGAGAARVWHRCALEALGGHDEKNFPDYGEDYDLVLRACERYRVERVHQVLYRYRQHSGNTARLVPQPTRLRRKALARRLALERRAGRLP